MPIPATAWLVQNAGMTADGPGALTLWLSRARDGDPAALQQAFVEVYAELRRLAHRQLAGQAADRTLDTTGLVHEAYLRLVGGSPEVRDRAHFFALAARIMRQVIVDYARERLADKRGGGDRGVPLEHVDVAERREAEHLLALDAALTRLAAEHPRRAQVVECRYFAGLSEVETAEALGVAERSVQRDWHEARAWLREQL
jgi:RNA polymerase sigma factor (TIGR02999 family)